MEFDILDSFICDVTVEEMYDYDYWNHETWEEELEEEFERN